MIEQNGNRRKDEIEMAKTELEFLKSTRRPQTRADDGCKKRAVSQAPDGRDGTFEHVRGGSVKTLNVESLSFQFTEEEKARE